MHTDGLKLVEPEDDSSSSFDPDDLLPHEIWDRRGEDEAPARKVFRSGSGWIIEDLQSTNLNVDTQKRLNA